MQHSTVRRGLAASAVSALAIAGLTITAPAAGAADSTDVRLISALTKVVSVRADSTFLNPETRIVAEVLEPTAEISFEVNADPQAADGDPDWSSIGSSVTSVGRFRTVDWNAGWQEAELVGTHVAIRAVATVGGGEPTYSTLRDVAIEGVRSDTDSVFTDLTGGYFVQPYTDSGRTQALVGISGGTSATDGTVELAQWRPADGAYSPLTNAAIGAADVKTFSNGKFVATDGGGFEAALPLSVFDADVDGHVAVRALRGSDDVAVATLHEQTIDRMVEGDRRESTPTATTTTLVVITAEGEPVAGAEVRRMSDGSVVGYTGGGGSVSVTQENGTTASYYVNATDTDGFDEDDDSIQVTIPAYQPVATDVRAVLADGSVFDGREYAAGDVALQVVDQAGEPFPGVRDVDYALWRDGEQESEPVVATTDANGRFAVPFDPADGDGRWHLDGALDDASPPVFRMSSFVSGDAALSLTPGAGQATAGGQITYTGTLTVEGEPVAGRTIDLTYVRGVELVPGTGADAGIVAGGTRRLSTTATTGADGRFSVTVDDPAEAGDPTEQGGRLKATVRSVGISASATTRFGTGKGTVKLKLTGSSKGAAADKLVVTAVPGAAGEKVTVLVKVGSKWKPVKTATLDRTGRLRLAVKDRNGAKATSYLARILASTRVEGSSSGVARVR